MYKVEKINNSYVTENPYITIIEHENNCYTVENSCAIFYGFCKKLDGDRAEFRVNKEFNKKTNKTMRKNTKAFREDSLYFVYIIENFAHNYNQ